MDKPTISREFTAADREAASKYFEFLMSRLYGIPRRPTAKPRKKEAK